MRPRSTKESYYFLFQKKFDELTDTEHPELGTSPEMPALQWYRTQLGTTSRSHEEQG